MGTCQECGKTFVDTSWGKKFCNHSCSAKFNNRGVCRNGKPLVKHQCEICNKLTYNSRFCSQKCTGASLRKASIEKFLSGKELDAKVIRKILILERGHKCEECGLSRWRKSPIPLDIHHKDGNAKNNYPSNLKLLCKNCHGLTSTFGVRNLGSGRAERRKEHIRRMVMSKHNSVQQNNAPNLKVQERL